MKVIRFALLCVALLASAAVSAGHRPVQEWRYTTSDRQAPDNTLYHGGNIGRRTGVDANNDLFIITTQYGATPCMVVTKVSGEVGTVLWRRDFCGGDGEALAVDAAGNVVVTGIQNNHGYVAKLAGNDGHTLWTYAPATGLFAAVSVGLDANGNPVVAGVDNDNIVVTKLSAATGTVAWTSRESTPGLANGNGTGAGFRAFAVNAAGVSAYSYSTLDAQGSSHPFTSSIDAGGARRWTVPGGTVMAVFGNGDVYDSQRRLAAASGAVLWTGTTLTRAILDPAENILGAQLVNASTTGGVDTSLVAMRLSPNTGEVAWSTSLKQPNVIQRTPDLAVSLGTFIIADSPSLPGNGSGRIGLQIVELDAFSGALLYNTIDANPNTRILLTELAVGRAAFLTGFYNSASSVTEVGVATYFMGDTHPAMDFNADGSGDLVWRHNGDNQHGIWLMNGQSASAANVVAGPPGAVVVQVADFDGDGKSDLLWRGPRGEYSITLMSGTTARSTTQVLGAGTGWEVVGKGDFDHDAKADLLWRHPTQGYGVWLMNGATPATLGAIAPPGPGFDVVLTGDFNHDGRTDLVWTHPDGRAAMTLMLGLNAGNTTMILGPSTGWTPVATGDFNGDGRTDLVWKHADGSYGLWLLDGARVTYAASLMGPGSGATLALVGDFNRDGSSDLLWKDAAGAYQGWLMASDLVLQSKTVFSGGGWSVVGSTDFDGDGKDDLLWRSAGGEYGTWLMDGLDARSATSVLPGGTGWEVAPN